jgi:hypothetical protein
MSNNGTFLNKNNNYKGNKMKIKLGLILFTLFIIIGCDNFLIKDNETSDDFLITAIIESEQENITIDEMPALSRNTIDQHYSNYIEIEPKIAPNLGYQVSMDRKDHKPGDHNEVYFNLNGRKLISRKWRHLKEGFKCFELLLPITLHMPDGSDIHVENEDGYKEIKSWYTDHYTREKPLLQYPINVIYKDGVMELIENDDAMNDIKSNCRKWYDDKREWNCFKLIYPITFVIEDGTTITMENSEDWSTLKAWHEANLESDKPILQYPVDITFRDGNTQTIHTDEEMRSAKEICND